MILLPTAACLLPLPREIVYVVISPGELPSAYCLLSSSEPEGILAAPSSNVFCKEFLFRNPQFEIRNRSPSPFAYSIRNRKSGEVLLFSQFQLFHNLIERNGGSVAFVLFCGS